MTYCTSTTKTPTRASAIIRTSVITTKTISTTRRWSISTSRETRSRFSGAYASAIFFIHIYYTQSIKIKVRRTRNPSPLFFIKTIQGIRRYIGAFCAEKPMRIQLTLLIYNYLIYLSILTKEGPLQVIHYKGLTCVFFYCIKSLVVLLTMPSGVKP